MTVSIIMPTYNCGKFIAASVESVVKQTFTDWELLITDDCSTDNTAEVLKPYLDKYPNIKYHCLEKNGGPNAARTEALGRATGKYVAFLDSDDLWDPDKLELQIGEMEKTGALFSCTGYRQIDEAGDPLRTVLMPPERIDYNKCLFLAPIGNLTAIYNREALGDYKVPNIKKRNDLALWLRVLRDAPYCMGVRQVLGSYRIRRNSVSSNKWVLAKYHWQLYRHIEKLPLWKCVWAMLCWAWVKGTHRGLDIRKNCDD